MAQQMSCISGLSLTGAKSESSLNLMILLHRLPFFQYQLCTHCILNCVVFWTIFPTIGYFIGMMFGICVFICPYRRSYLYAASFHLLNSVSYAVVLPLP